MASLRMCPKFAATFDISQWKTEAKKFRSSFPDHVAHRDAVAHSAELSRSSAQVQKHAAENLDTPEIKATNGARIFLSDHVRGDDFLQTKDGKLVSLSLSDTSAATLRAIADAFQKPFNFALNRRS